METEDEAGDRARRPEGVRVAQDRVNTPAPDVYVPPTQEPAAASPKSPPPEEAAQAVPAPFAHHAEADFAELLNFYRIPWLYEPTSFAIEWDGDAVTEMFT